MKADLDRCKKLININMQKDVDYDEMTKEERENLVGPERLASLHRALKEIGVSYFDVSYSSSVTYRAVPIILARYMISFAESQEDTYCYSFNNWPTCGTTR